MRTILQLQSKLNIADSDLGEEIAAAVRESGAKVITAFLKGKPKSEVVTKANALKCFDVDESELKGLSRYLFAWKLYRYCKSENVDLVIAHRYKQIHLISLVRMFMKIPVIGVVHGVGDFDRKVRKRQFRGFVSQGWTIVAVSEAVKQYLQSLGATIDDKNVRVINNAIDLTRASEVLMSRENARKELGIDLDSVVVGTIGRMVPVKAQLSLLQAVPLLKEKHQNLKVVVIGDGRERGALEEYVCQKNLNDTVVLSGWKDNASRYLSAFDVFVLPSRSEGLPLALLEAMSANLPVAGSDIEAIRSVLPTPQRVFPVDNFVAISEVLDSLLSLSDKQRKDIGAVSHKHVCAKHDVSDFRKSYQVLIESVLVDKV